MTSPSAITTEKPALTAEQCKELISKRDLNWFDLVIGGKQIGDAEMRAYLDYIRLKEDMSGQSFQTVYAPDVRWPIYKVHIGLLPTSLSRLIREIRDEWSVVDKSALKSSLTPTEHGGMRAWHQNENGMLPKHDSAPGWNSVKASKYQKYIEENKGLPSKQVKKGIEQKYTGYVEYTLGAWRSTQGRLVYDYYNNHFYLTPGHYASGDFSRNAFYLVVCD
jgi:hypothetical protein